MQIIKNPLFRSLILSVTAGVLALLAGCGSLGPKTMDRDQMNYGNSIGDNWKDQMLANIVKIRYVDMPVFVDVGSIVSGYSLSTTVNGRLGFGDSFTAGNTRDWAPAEPTPTGRPSPTCQKLVMTT